MSSPTQRSLKELRNHGYYAEVVERFNRFSMTRHDFAGFADILGFKIGENGVLAVQTTSTGNINARLQKIAENANVEKWLLCKNKVLVHGWSKKGKRGKRKTYQLRSIEVVL